MSVHLITYKFTGLLNFDLRAELPLENVTFSKVLNGVGAWAGTLNTEDSGVRKSNWVNATGPNLTSMWVDIDGKLVYGGATRKRSGPMTGGPTQLSGEDFNFYLARREQARDYTEYTDPEGHNWASAGAPALSIAYNVLSQALAKRFSIPIKVVASGPEANGAFWITFSAPIAQHQTLAAVLVQMQELGFMSGIDYAQDVAYVGGRPTTTLTLSYPRRGEETADPVTIDLSHDLGGTYDEDGTSQADRIVSFAGATKIRSQGEVYPPAQALGYPLLEEVVSFSGVAPSGNALAMLRAYAEGSLAVSAFPLTIPVVVLPMFGTPSIHELDVGQDVILESPSVAGDQPLNNPRFPAGMKARFRIVRIDCSIPQQGVATMALTLNLPPALAPVEPPEIELAEAETKAEKEKKAAGLIALTKEAEEARAAQKTAEEERAAKIKEELEAKEAREKEEQEALSAAGTALGIAPGANVKITIPKLIHYIVKKLKFNTEQLKQTGAEAAEAREKAERAQITGEKGGGELSLTTHSGGEGAFPINVEVPGLTLLVLNYHHIEAGEAAELEITIDGIKAIGGVGQITMKPNTCLSFLVSKTLNVTGTAPGGFFTFTQEIK